MMSVAEAERRIAWQEKVYQDHLNRSTEVQIEFLGRPLVVAADVFQPAPPEFNLLAAAVLQHVRETDVVLDMGTGSGVQAILAASRAQRVLAVDANPEAVRCAARNVELNGLTERIEIRQSDLFENVEGRFDVILFDPPFRWTKPRDRWEQSTADEGYRSLRIFLQECRGHLTEGGRVLLFFGTSGDLAYVQRLVRENGFRRRQLMKARHPAGWEYFTYRLTDGRDASA
ncbi:MAG: methyltransferase [Acidobacteria bacterium]|nr:methyltransferase [Acidobacteriota bacterium]